MNVIGQKHSKFAIFYLKMAKILPSQNFPGIQSMIFSKKTIRTTSIPKLGRFTAAFGSYRPKTLKNDYFGQKWTNFGLKVAKISPYQSLPGI